MFNNYTAAQTTNGHKYSGFVEGGPCENTLGRGYAVIVDQGKLNYRFVAGFLVDFAFV